MREALTVRRHRAERHARRRRVRVRPGRPARGRARCAGRSTPPSCSIALRTSSRWSPTPTRSAGASLLVNRRNARFFVADGGSLEETDRVEDDVHSQHDQGGWSQARYQRGVEKEKDDHLVHVAEVAFDRLQAARVRPAAGRRARRARARARAEAAPVPARADRGRLHLDVENSGHRRGPPRRRGGDRGLAAARASARRSTGSSRASAAAARAPRASRPCSRRSTRRASRCC